MKTLVLPTDFSTVADNAMQYAARMAQHLQAELLLTHIYQIPVSMNDMPVILISADELKKSADENLERCRQEISLSFPDVTVNTESRLGDVNDELNDICNAVQPFAIVLGSQGTTGFERLLFGSTTLSVLRHSNFPVLTVPEHYKEFSMKKIVLAADMQDVNTMPVNKIIEVAQLFNAHLQVVHVTSKAEANATAERDVLMQQLQPVKATYQTIHSDTVREGLSAYLEEERADLLLVLPHEHNLMERLFTKLHAEDLISHATIPVMAIKC